MTTAPLRNVAASVKARLLNASRQGGIDFNNILRRYANERFLYRLGVSPFAEKFVLKGSNLFLIWQNGRPYRQTIDSDLLCLGRAERGWLKGAFGSICQIQPMTDDGMSYDAESIHAEDIRMDDKYGGTAIALNGFLGKARIPLQFDVGVGDAITPSPEHVAYPSLLDYDCPSLQAYPMVTAVAEKAEAMVSLGMANSRMKDFADILTLAKEFDFSFSALHLALQRTFERRGIPWPETVPVCFRHEFFASPQKQIQWRAFRRHNRLATLPELFSEVAQAVADFLCPLLFAIINPPSQWRAGQGWE